MKAAGRSCDEIKGVGIGVPGAVREDGTVNKCVNLGWGVFNVAQTFKDMTGYEVKVGNEDYNLINKMLKIEDNIITDDLDIKKYIVEDGNYKMTIYYEKVETEEDKELKLKQIESLKNSIARRKKLLDNKNYVEKAPEKLVLEEKEKLMNEEKLLANLLA